MSAGNQRPKPVADLVLESSLDSVDVAENHAIAAAERAGMPEEDVFRFGYAVREAMVNAVVHGNRYSSNKTVGFRIFEFPGQIEVRIQDQGDGFDTGGVADPLAEENLLSQSGRGLALIRAFVDELLVAPADGGGTAAVLRKFVRAGTESPPQVSEE
jgi:serine/threonine-protein kinase RsbW